MAGRILGMGDMLTLIEQAERAFEADQAEKAAARLMEGEFTLDDFLEQMQSIKKMGSLSSLLGMMPGMPKELKNAKISDDDLKPIEAIIRSMTLDERARPQIINGSRRARIAQRLGHRPRRRHAPHQAVRRHAEDDEADGDGRQEGQARPGIPGMGRDSGARSMPDMAELEQMMGGSQFPR